MSIKDKLERIKNQEESEKKIDWKARRDDWINNVTELYADIESWLSEYIKEGYISVSKNQIELYEEYLGKYSISTLELRIGKQAIVFEPVGSLIIGATGRLDVYLSGYKSEKIMLLRGIDKNEKPTWLASTSKNRRDVSAFDKNFLEKLIDNWIP